MGTQYPWQWLTKHKQGKVDSCCKAWAAPESTREPHNVHLCGRMVACAWNLLKDLQNMQISSSFCISYSSQSSYVKVYIYSLKRIILIIFWNYWKLIYLFLKYAWEVTRFDHCLFSFNKGKLISQMSAVLRVTPRSCCAADGSRLMTRASTTPQHHHLSTNTMTTQATGAVLVYVYIQRVHTLVSFFMGNFNTM